MPQNDVKSQFRHKYPIEFLTQYVFWLIPFIPLTMLAVLNRSGEAEPS
jgi:hypothetical protein